MSLIYYSKNQKIKLVNEQEHKGLKVLRLIRFLKDCLIKVFTHYIHFKFIKNSRKNQNLAKSITRGSQMKWLKLCFRIIELNKQFRISRIQEIIVHTRMTKRSQFSYIRRQMMIWYRVNYLIEVYLNIIKIQANKV